MTIDDTNEVLNLLAKANEGIKAYNTLLLKHNKQVEKYNSNGPQRGTYTQIGVQPFLGPLRIKAAV